MAERKYYYIKNHTSSGEMAVSHRAFETIATNAIKHLKGVYLHKGRPKKIKSLNLYRPIVCEFDKNGTIKIKIDISLKKGASVKDTCVKIQQEIENAILLAVESAQVKIDINVASIKI